MEKAINMIGKERRAKKIRRREKDAKNLKLEISDGNEVNKIIENVEDTSSLAITTKPKKKGPVRNKISKDQKLALVESGRALFLSLPKSLKKRKSAAQTALKPFISALKLRGIEGVAPSGNSYYALLFESEDKRNKAARKIGKSTFKWEGLSQKLVVHNFVETSGNKDAIFQISAILLATGPEVRDAIVEHYLQIDPLYTGTFTMQQVYDHQMPTGKWAFKFDGKGPNNFAKKMKIGKVTVLVTKVPFGTCSFCENSGHNIFNCTIKAKKVLGGDILRGKAGLYIKEDTPMEE